MCMCVRAYVCACVCACACGHARVSMHAYVRACECVCTLVLYLIYVKLRGTVDRSRGGGGKEKCGKSHTGKITYPQKGPQATICHLHSHSLTSHTFTPSHLHLSHPSPFTSHTFTTNTPSPHYITSSPLTHLHNKQFCPAHHLHVAYSPPLTTIIHIPMAPPTTAPPSLIPHTPSQPLTHSQPHLSHPLPLSLSHTHHNLTTH